MKPVSFFTILKSEHYKLRFNIGLNGQMYS